MQAIDPNLPVYDVRTMEDRIAASFAQTRGTMLLLLVTASLAAALAGVAIYGSIWYSVSQRLPEIGIGAWRWARRRASVFADVLRGAVWLTGIGAADWASRGTRSPQAALIAGLLFDTPRHRSGDARGRGVRRCSASLAGAVSAGAPGDDCRPDDGASRR